MGKKGFSISNEELMNAAFYKHNFVRSRKSRDVDNASTRNVTNSVFDWWPDNRLNRKDLLGIDTVVRVEPKGFTKEKGKKAFKKVDSLFKGVNV